MVASSTIRSENVNVQPDSPLTGHATGFSRWVPDMDLSAEFARYLWRLARLSWVSAGSLLIGFGLTVASAARRHSVGLPWWGWLLLAETVLLIAAFIDRRGNMAMDPTHAGWLQEILESLDASIRQDRPCRYADSKRSDSYVKERFRRHFPELVDLLDEWDSLPQRLRDTEVNVYKCLVDDVVGRWPDLWATRAVADCAFNRIRRGLEPSSPPWPQSFHLLDFREQDKSIVLGTPSGGTVLRTFDGPLTDDDQRQAERQVRELRNWSETMYKSDVAQAWRDLAHRKEHVRSGLLSQLERLKPPTRLRKRRCDENCAVQ